MNNKFDIENVSSVFTTEDSKDFICQVKFAGFAEVLPFRASANDSEAHGRLIHAQILAGDYGVPAAFVPYVEPEEERLKRELSEKNRSDGLAKLLALGLTTGEITAMGIKL